MSDQEHAPASADRPYLQRLREVATNPRSSYGRFIASTVLVSGVLSVAANHTDYESPLAIEQKATPAAELEFVVPGEERVVPAEVASTVEAGPGIQLSVDQEYAGDFEALPLDDEQLEKLETFIADVEAILAEDPDQVDVTVTGSASSESQIDSIDGDANLDRASTNNERLAKQRGDLTAQIVAQRFADDERINIHIESEEVELSPAQISLVDDIAAAQGLSRSDFISAYNRGELAELSEEYTEVMRGMFDNNRGASITSVVSRTVTPYVGPCDEVIRHEVDPDMVHTGIIPGKPGSRTEVVIAPGFLFPLPRRRKKTSTDEVSSEAPEPEIAESPVTHTDESATKEVPAATEENDTAAHMSGKTPVGGAGGGRPGVYSGARYPGGRMSAHHQRAAGRMTPQIERGRLAPSALRKLGRVSFRAALPVALAFLPFIPGWETEKADAVPPTSSECFTTSVEPGKRHTTYVNSPFHVVKHLLDRSPDWNKQFKFEQWVTPNTVTRTTLPYRQIEVDANGTIIDTTRVDSTDTIRMQQPTFTQ